MAFWELLKPVALLFGRCCQSDRLCVKTVVIMTVAAVCRVQDALDEEILHLSGTYPE